MLIKMALIAIAIGIIYFIYTFKKSKKALKDPEIYRQYIEKEGYNEEEQKEFCDRFGLDHYKNAGSVTLPDSVELICSYVNANGQASIQHLANFTVDDEENPKYIQGWSIKHDRPITLVPARIVKIYDSLEAAENEFCQSDLDETRHLSSSISLGKTQTMEICFTGFPKAIKESLNTIAESNGMKVRTRVTKNLNVLCCGEKAGPKKLEEAMAKGIFILNKSQFEAMIETGEVPEDV